MEFIIPVGCDQAHTRGLSIGLVDAGDVVGASDWLLAEDWCYGNRCTFASVFVNKAVFMAESAGLCSGVFACQINLVFCMIRRSQRKPVWLADSD